MTVTPRDHGAPFYKLTDFASFYLSEAATCPATCPICPTSSSVSKMSLVTEGNTVMLMIDDTEIVSLSVENFEVLLNFSEINNKFERETMLTQMNLHFVQNRKAGLNLHQTGVSVKLYVFTHS